VLIVRHRLLARQREQLLRVRVGRHGVEHDLADPLLALGPRRLRLAQRAHHLGEAAIAIRDPVAQAQDGATVAVEVGVVALGLAQGDEECELQVRLGERRVDGQRPPVFLPGASESSDSAMTCCALK